MTNAETILITGATGEIGGALVEGLRGTSAPIRVMCRRDDQVEAFEREGVAAVVADLTRPESLPAAMAGCGRLFLLPPSKPDTRGVEQEVISIAKSSGIEQVVKVSSLDANVDSSVFWAADHAVSDAALKRSGLAWTRLAPAAFMSNLFTTARAIRAGILPGTSKHGATTWVDPGDIARAAQRVLLDDALQGGAGEQGKSYMLTGTHPLSFHHVADILSTELGRRVRYLHVPAPVMNVGLRLAGVDRATARGLTNQFADIVRNGKDDVLVYSDDLTHLLGEPPTDMATFIRRHRAKLS